MKFHERAMQYMVVSTVVYATSNFNLIRIIKNQPDAVIQIDNECGK
jgi:hypothetical protein